MVIVVSFYDHPAYASGTNYKDYSDAVAQYMMQYFARAKLLDIGQFAADDFLDMSHLRASPKHQAADRLVKGIMNKSHPKSFFTVFRKTSK